MVVDVEDGVRRICDRDDEAVEDKEEREVFDGVRKRVFSEEDDLVRGAAVGMITPDFFSPARENFGALSAALSSGAIMALPLPLPLSARGDGTDGRAPDQRLEPGPLGLFREVLAIVPRLLALDWRESDFGEVGGE